MSGADCRLGMPEMFPLPLGSVYFVSLSIDHPFRCCRSDNVNIRRAVADKNMIYLSKAISLEAAHGVRPELISPYIVLNECLFGVAVERQHSRSCTHGAPFGQLIAALRSRWNPAIFAWLKCQGCIAKIEMGSISCADFLLSVIVR